MEDAYKEALKGARIVDLQDDSYLTLPDTGELVALGLTVDDRLSFTVDGFLDDEDDLVLTLCHVMREGDGHWLLPNAFIPCALNDGQVDDKCLLSPGSIVKVGDREMRYSLPIESRVRLNTGGAGGGGGGGDAPPPKPRRTSLDLDQPLHQPRQMAPIEEEEEGSPGKTDEKARKPEADEDLIQHLATSEDVAQLACSYVSHQVALYTDLLLSTEELDFMFKSIQSCSESNISHMHKFVKMYNKIQAKGEQEVWPIHGPVIYLLSQLLNSTLDSGEMAALWIKLLATFANFSPNLPAFIQHKVAPVVMAAMAVHGLQTNLQQYAATVLSQLATFTPPIGQKGPVREAGVDLVIHATTIHVHETLVLRPALRTLANLIQTYSNLADDALSIGAFQIDPEQPELSSTVVLQEVERSMGILDYIEEKALPVVMETMENNLRDVAIQTEGRRLLAFFVEDGLNVARKKSLSKISTRKVRFQLDPEDPNSIVSTDSILTDFPMVDPEQLPPVRPLEKNENKEKKKGKNPFLEDSESSDDENDMSMDEDILGGTIPNVEKPVRTRKKVIGSSLDMNDIKSEIEVTYVEESVDLDLPFEVEPMQDKGSSKSLMDELAEIKEDEEDGGNIDGSNKASDTKETEILPVAVQKPQQEGDLVQSNENTVDENIETSEQDEVKKSNSLKRGVSKMLMTGRAMDKAFKLGKSKMFSRMKRGLRFGDLRKKEDKMVNDHIGQTQGEDSKEKGTDEGEEQNETDEILSSLILAGVTTNSSSTDDTEVETGSESENIALKVGEKAIAPPLLVPSIDPKVKGSQNTVNNLINLWKRKEVEPKSDQMASEDERPIAPPRRSRKWRPFENEADNDNLPSVTKPNKTKQQDEQLTDALTRDSKESDVLTDEEVFMAKRANRGHRGSLAVIPEVGRLMSSARPSLTDSLELATWASSYMSVRGQDIDDIDPELEQQVRLNKIKWKSVVAEIKGRIVTDSMPVQQKPDYVSENKRYSNYDVTATLTQRHSGLSATHSEKVKPRPAIRTSVTTFPTTDLNKEQHHEANLLAARCLMVQAVLKTWQLSPSLAADLLDAPCGELLISAGATPSLVSDIRPDVQLDRPFTQLHPVLSSKLMAILTSLPSSDEVRLELLEEVIELLRADRHLYHVQVGTDTALLLLHYNMQQGNQASSEDSRVLERLQESLQHLRVTDSPHIKESVTKLQYILDFLIDHPDNSAIFV